MNDRFRFRAWDKDIKRYWEPGNFDLRRACKDKSLIIEQCTGLKDKNCRLIYEGDIVKNGKEIAKVLWNKDGCFELVGKCWVAPTYFTNLKNWEIIGNIHENKELLRGDEKCN